jgi:hypothetical protein
LRENKIIGLLFKIPEKAVLQLVTSIEEEIEVIDVDEDQPIQKSPTDDNKTRSNFSFSVKYFINIIALVAIILVMILTFRTNISNDIHVPVPSDVYFEIY